MGHDSPAFHLCRHQDEGVFDPFAMHAQALWDEGRDPVGDSSHRVVIGTDPQDFVIVTYVGRVALAGQSSPLV